MVDIDPSFLFEKRNGILFPRMSPKRWAELETFTLKPDDVFIATYPKSGTTWVQQIVKLLRNNGKRDNVKLDASIPWLEVLDSAFSKAHNYYPEMITSSDALSPRAFKSHFPYEYVPGGLPHTTPAKYIYVMRNPKDVCVSYFHHRSMIEEMVWESYFSEFLSTECLYGNWYDHIFGWWKHRDAANILFVKYEDMKMDPITSIRTISEFIGIRNSTEDLIQNVVQNSSFSSMKNDLTSNYSWVKGEDKVFSRKGEFMRKGEIGSWKQRFSEQDNERFDAAFNEKLAKIGLSFKYDHE